jgi:hypothetical protein
MDECKADTAPIYDWAEQLGDTHARPRRRSYIHLVQRKQPVTPVNYSNVKFFLLAPRKQRRSERSKVRWRLHALTPRRPPRGRRGECLHYLLHAFRLFHRHACANQSRADARVKELLRLTLQRVTKTFSKSSNSCQHFDRSEEVVVTIYRFA